MCPATAGIERGLSTGSIKIRGTHLCIRGTWQFGIDAIDFGGLADI